MVRKNNNFPTMKWQVLGPYYLEARKYDYSGFFWS